MKGCAKFLNFIALIVFLILILGTVALAGATAVIGLRPDMIPEEAYGAFEAFKINGEPVTMEMIKSFHTPFLIILGVLALSLILNLIIVANIRTALKEVANEEPFSIRCSKALSTASLVVVIDGLLGIALSFYAAFILTGLTMDGNTVISISSNLSFILVAVFLKMLSGVSAFGRG